MILSRAREPLHGDTRIVEKFLLWPKSLRIELGSRNYEKRWLSREKIVQKFRNPYDAWIIYGWVDTAWADWELLNHDSN